MTTKPTEESEIAPEDEFGNEGSLGPDDADSSMRTRLEGLMPDLLKKAVNAAGLGNVLAGEEGFLTIPKEVASYLMSTAGATKDEVVRIVAREIREFLQNLNLHEELA